MKFKNPKLNSGFLQELSGMLLLFLMALSIFSPLLFSDKAIFHRDYHFITYPFRYFLGQAYQQGVLPYWAPNVYGGMPFMSLFHPGVFYPPSLLFYLQDTVLATNLFYFLHFLILGVSIFLLGRLWKLSFAARLCSSVTGMLSGYIIGSVLLSNYFLAAVWLPIIFWFYQKFRQEKHIGYFIGTVLAIATQTLAACPEISIMTVGLLFLHELWFVPKEQGFAVYLRLTFSLGMAVVLALGLSALQLWPAAELLPFSPRETGMSYEVHSTWSLQFSKLATLVLSPFYIGDSGSGEFFTGFLHTLYMGILSLGFIFIAFFLRKEKPVGFWLVIFVLGIFFALGQYNPLYKYFYHTVPLTHLFRFPSKYFFVSSFAAVFLAGYVLDYILKHTESRHFKMVPVLSVFIVVFGMVCGVGLWQPALDMGSSLAILFIFSFAYILFYFKKIRKTVFAVIVLLLVFTDLSMKDFKLLPLIDRKFYDEPPAYMEYLKDTSGKHRVYSGRIQRGLGAMDAIEAPSALHRIRLLKQYLTPYTGMVYGVEHVAGKPGLGLGLKDQLIWSDIFRKTAPEMRLRILERSNVGYWINLDQETRFKPDGEAEILPDRILVLKNALPRAYLVPKIKVMEEKAILNTYYAASFDPLKEVLLTEPVAFQPSASFKGKVEQVEYRPNHVTIKTRQEGNGFLVLNDTYFPGWTVTVDGKVGTILQANHYYRAVQLGPGEHTLEFDYFPEGFKEGLITSFIFLLILIALPLCKPIKRLRFEPSAPSDTGPENLSETDTTYYK
jgi:hypothetical protein